MVTRVTRNTGVKANNCSFPVFIIKESDGDASCTKLVPQAHTGAGASGAEQHANAWDRTLMRDRVPPVGRKMACNPVKHGEGFKPGQVLRNLIGVANRNFYIIQA
jgi:hypothetical protein